jgi:hypothetical protein
MIQPQVHVEIARQRHQELLAGAERDRLSRLVRFRAREGSAKGRPGRPLALRQLGFTMKNPSPG